MIKGVKCKIPRTSGQQTGTELSVWETSRGVDHHFRGPGQQRVTWREGKTSGDATRKWSKGSTVTFNNSWPGEQGLWRTRLHRPQRPSPSEEADLNWDTAWDSVCIQSEWSEYDDELTRRFKLFEFSQREKLEFRRWIFKFFWFIIKTDIRIFPLWTFCLRILFIYYSKSWIQPVCLLTAVTLKLSY